ncbi:LLM class flavin-dependent oxidoreductase [Streptomyces sp. NPDC086010]|uniref:LLM class flavin-dependent oxidoreductase n=1 Tax=Streptomyces sp. NPDC086010 TaxID=3365745 RepID=UPI0037CE7EDB
MSDSAAPVPAGDRRAPVPGLVRGSTYGPLSLLDLVTVGEGQTSTHALRAAAQFADKAERLGYHRFWVAEHHGTAAVASSAPAVLLAHLAATTRTIRLGSGGAILTHHHPLVIAEQFGTLHALHPGRIDLGIGRGPGADPATARVLRYGADAPTPDTFSHRIEELTRFLDDDQPPGHPHEGVHAVPGIASAPGGGRPPVWLLGSSERSALAAGRLGLPFAFGHHFNAKEAVPALERYRQSFRPSAVLDRPYSMISVTAIAADTEREARRLAGSGALLTLRVRAGRPGLVPTPDDAERHHYSKSERHDVESLLSGMVWGTKESVHAGLQALRQSTGADELMVTGFIHGAEARLRSIELIAQAWGLKPAP